MINAKTVTVKVVDKDGKAYKFSLEGQGGLKPLSHVIVTGVVAARPNDKVLIVNATGIHVSPNLLLKGVPVGTTPQHARVTPVGADNVTVKVEGMT